MSNVVSVADFALGSTVVGSDNQDIGVINEVVEQPGAPSQSPASFYIEIMRGGFLGLGAQHLYIPVGAVREVRDDGAIVLSCTIEEAEKRYTQEPT